MATEENDKNSLTSEITEYEALLTLQAESDRARGEERTQFKQKIGRLQQVVIAAESLDIGRLRVALANLWKGDRLGEDCSGSGC